MKEIQELLTVAIKKLYGIDFEVEITVAPEGTGADFASNAAMKLAKVLQKNPRVIAEEIKSEMNEAMKTEIAGPGFLNFVLDDNYYAEKIKNLEQNFEKEMGCDTYAGKTVICEFSDPNPFKVLHVGHLYTSVVGDAISRLYEYAGAKVIRANFGGDVGLHVGKTMWALLHNDEHDLTIEKIAANYVEGTRAYEDDEAAKKEIVEINKKVYEIAQQDLHDSDLAEMYWNGRELSYQYFEDFYAHIGVKFDKYYPESTVAARGLKEVKNGLDKGVYEMSDGAVVYKGEKVGLHTRVFINKEGLPTYEAKDVGLIFTKWDDYKFDKSVVITGNDIIDYMKVVLTSVGEMNPELPARTAHLTHGQVKLPGSVKMSSRKGNFLKAVDVLEMVSDELKNSYESEDFDVALGAIKYAFLKYKIGGDIVFDPKESVKMTGNSGPYLQYSCVRAQKIQSNLSRPRSSSPAVAGSSHCESLVSDSGHGLERFELNLSEKTLVKKILQYKDVLTEAVVEMAPHKVANYLYELAQEFSRFYEKCPVVGDEREGVRGRIVVVYLKTMQHGLNLMGIEIPEEM